MHLKAEIGKIGEILHISLFLILFDGNKMLFRRSYNIIVYVDLVHEVIFSSFPSRNNLCTGIFTQGKKRGLAFLRLTPLAKNLINMVIKVGVCHVGMAPW